VTSGLCIVLDYERSYKLVVWLENMYDDVFCTLIKPVFMWCECQIQKVRQSYLANSRSWRLDSNMMYMMYSV